MTGLDVELDWDKSILARNTYKIFQWQSKPITFNPQFTSVSHLSCKICCYGTCLMHISAVYSPMCREAGPEFIFFFFQKFK